MNITKFSINRPVTTMMFLLAFAVIGIISFTNLPLEYFPAIDIPFVAVYVPYGGTTPEAVENEVTAPIEEVMSMIEGVKRISSESSSDGSTVYVMFDWGQDINVKALETREKVESIKHLLPSDVERFYVFKFNTADMPVLEIRLSSNKNLAGAYDLLERNIKKRLERIEGVAEVNLEGVAEKQIIIELNPEKLISHNIAVGSLIEILQDNNFVISNGILEQKNNEIIVKSDNKIKSLEELKNIIVSPIGIRLKDLGTIVYKSPDLEYGRHLNGKFAIGITIKKNSDANTVAVSRKILVEIEKIKQIGEMKGIEIYVMNNQGDGIVSSLIELLKSGIIGAVLAFFVLYFFLRNLKNTFIVIISVPFSMLVTGIAMYYFDISLNILSMMGLMLAVGMLVDNAVVTMESIHKIAAQKHAGFDIKFAEKRQYLYSHFLMVQKHQKGNGFLPQLEFDYKKASIKGASKTALAITAGTITTIIVFLPNIVNSNNQISIFLKHVGIPLVIALAASLLISLTGVPVLTSLIKHSRDELKNAPIIDKITAIYLKILNWFLVHHKTSIVIIVILLLSVAIPAKFVKKDNPSGTDKQVRIFYHINSTYSLEKVEESVNTIEDYLQKHKDEFNISSVYSFYGTNRASTTILLNEKNDSSLPKEDLMKRIKENLPKIAVGNPSFEWKNESQDDKLKIRIFGKSSKELIQISDNIVERFRNNKNITDIRNEAKSGTQEIIVAVNKEKASKYGFSAAAIAQTISTSIRGMNLNKMSSNSKEIGISLKFSEENRRNLDDLKNIPIFNRNGKMYKLSSVADFSKAWGPGSINRQNRETSLNITVILSKMTKDESRDFLRNLMKSIKLPNGYGWDFGSSFNNFDEGNQTMMINLLLALALIYFVMAALFESFILPISIWTSIVFAIVGVWWFFLITNTTFSLMAWIGVLILVGVVVNNGIVFIEYINTLINKGYSRDNAIRKAGKERLRPILMTAATTVLSMIPLCITNTMIGGDGPPYYPMARAIVGGLTFSTVITLLILPTIYIVLDDLRVMYTKRIFSRLVSSAKVE